MTSAGLYCPVGDFYVDPWKKVPHAVMTHAHSDHARSGMGHYYSSVSGEDLLRNRVGKNVKMTSLEFGQQFTLGKAVVSLHPAGHILGSAQVRIECGRQVAVVTGDYNSTHVHQAAEPFETVACDLLITESTFALPIYQWPDEDVVTGEIHAWWKANQAHGRTSILPCYPLGKTQRILASLDASVGPIAVVGPARGFLPFYESAGVNFPPVMNLNEESISELKGKGLVLISFAGKEPPLLQQLQPISFGSASGWMQIRSVRRGREFDRGFILSDHSDWNGLLHSIKTSGASRIGVTHGQTDVFSRYLNEVEGLDAFVVSSHFERGSKEEST